MTLDPDERIASHAQVRVVVLFFITWVLRASFHRTQRLSAVSGQESSENGPRLVPRRSHRRQRPSINMSAEGQIVQGVTATLFASPFVVDVAEATASIERILIGQLKAVLFAERRAKLGNFDQLHHPALSPIMVSATPVDLRMYGIFTAVWFIISPALQEPQFLILETRPNLLEPDRFCHGVGVFVAYWAPCTSSNFIESLGRVSTPF